MHRILAMTPALLILCLSAAPLSAQDPEFDQALEGLKTAQKEKSDPDQIHFATEIGKLWEKADDKQRKTAFGLIGKNLRFIKNQEILDATVDVLALMTGGPKDRDAEMATKILVVETSKKTTEDNVTYYVRVLASIGLLQTKRGAETLTKLLKDKDYDVRAGAVLALANYSDKEINERRDIVEEILKMYTGASSAANDPRDTTAKKRLEKVQGVSEATLKKLTGQEIAGGANEWWKWWNDHGKRDKEW